ncbi:hypothetical protein B0T16DRAFT_456578 [Cercophora newfieldiana]|uniref:Heterokaryon incompatibility domain-containing protein n=1 Tax=Cercophora newfieldiana TaxID=92897 RepID=A0AA39YAP4_9PEZI|nr:hypothetical protein B0T16DRAFT_456578 [Cercophora newfieldiana]
MGEIYKRATRVVAWVGEHNNDSRQVCDFLQSVGRTLRSTRHVSDEANWKEVERIALEEARPVQLLVLRFGEFFRRSWFTRMWPIQEVTLPLPENVTLLCDDSGFSFSYIRVGWQVLAGLGVLLVLVDLDQAVALQFYLADALALKRGHPDGLQGPGKALITDLSQRSMRSIMRATRFKSCSLAKDKFFALLGIFQELGIPHKVDVSRYAQMTGAEVFMAVFESCVALDGNLDAMGMCQSAHGYMSHDDFWKIPQESQETWTNALSGAVRGILPLISRGAIDNAPSWRKGLPSWAPDFTQWTPSRMNSGDISFIRSYTTGSLWARFLSEYWWPSTHQNTLTAPASGCGAGAPRATPRGAAMLRIALSKENRQILQVRGRVVGMARSMGSIDSFDLFQQWMSMVLNIYLLKRPNH